MIRILIGADIVPTKSNFDLFRSGDINALVGEAFAERLREADLVSLNLEVPLTDITDPIEKCGPNLQAPVNTVKGLKEINPHFFTLANNHIMDQNAMGLYSTMTALSDNGIAFAGAGQNLADAAKPHIAEIKGKKVGFYCCAEHEFSIADEDHPGANPFDPLTSFDDVRRLSAECDAVIVLYHGGKEHYRYPSPLLRRVFRKLADCGADLVIAQHTHCIGCMEEYNGSALVYGQGNFLFDHSDSEFWKTGLLIDFTIDDSGAKHTGYIPLVKNGAGVRIADGQAAKEIMNGFDSRSREIKTEGFVEKKYSELAGDMVNEYYSRISGGAGGLLPVRMLNKLTKGGLYRRIYSKKYLPALRNAVECESHRELLLRGIIEENKK